MVALYTIAPAQPADVTVAFGPLSRPDRFHTWTRRAQGDRRPLSIFVYGMLPQTSYRMQATLRYADGTVVQDIGHTFTTGPLPARFRSWRLVPHPVPGRTVEPGLDLFDSSTGLLSQAVLATNDGRILWTFEMPDRLSHTMVMRLYWFNALRARIAGWFGWHLYRGPIHDRLGALAQRDAATPAMRALLKPSEMEFLYPIRALPDGNFLLLYGLSSQLLLDGPPPPETFSVLREINPAGQTVRQITIAQLNRRLRAAGYANMHLQTFHHDVAVLPDGHWIVIANQFRPGSDPGPGQTDVFGDDLIDLDPRLNPVWVWSSFQHLDINRHPYWFPDWTHANAVLYSASDGDLLLSLRHQNWIVKIDYRNGRGSGRVLWRLGPGGDFKLVGGHGPQDWQYAQHEPSFLGPATSSAFDLTMMDNGNRRILANGAPCTTGGAHPTCYTTVPVFQVNQKNMTVRVIARRIFPPSMFSAWGGGSVPLPNGNLLVTLSSEGPQHTDSEIFQLSGPPGLDTVWKMDIPGTNVYRTQWLPSPYPGVRWQP